MRPWVLPVVVTVAAAGVITAVGTTVADAVSADDCTAVKLIVVPGTWETTPTADPNTPQGMLRPVVSQLENRYPGRVSAYWVPYSASAFDQGLTYDDSKATGVKAADAAISRFAGSCPNTRFATIGYSQGADVAGTVAQQIGKGDGPIPPDRFLAGGLVADPGQGTKGAVDLGAIQPGTQGIAGPRPGGYQAVSGQVATVCVRGDMYCALPQKDEYLVAIGEVFSHIGVDNALQSAEDEQAVTTDLTTADGKSADLSVLSPKLEEIQKQATKGHLTTVANRIDNLLPLVKKLQKLERAVGSPAIVKALLATPEGSQTHQAGEVLQAMDQIDFVGLTKDLSAALKAADNGNDAKVVSLALDAAQQIAPLVGIPSAQVSRATVAIEGLRPAAVLAQAHTILDGVSSVDYADIRKAIRSIPSLIRAGDTAGLYKVLTTVENDLMPLAKTANEVDLQPVAALLRMFPVGSDERVVGDVLTLLDRVDWVRLANDLLTMQDALTHFDLKDPPHINLRDPEKTLTDVFGINVEALVPTISDLVDLGLSVAGVALPKGTVQQLLTTDLSTREIVSESVQVAIFYGTGRHVAYGTAPVDKTGRSALTVMADWLQPRIGRAA
jgi:cutinase